MENKTDTTGVMVILWDFMGFDRILSDFSWDLMMKSGITLQSLSQNYGNYQHFIANHRYPGVMRTHRDAMSNDGKIGLVYPNMAKMS